MLVCTAPSKLMVVVAAWADAVAASSVARAMVVSFMSSSSSVVWLANDAVFASQASTLRSTPLIARYRVPEKLSAN
jgi:hypothetical protein